MMGHVKGKRRGRGEGTLEQRGPDKWRLRVYVGQDAQGRPLQTSKTIHAKSKTEALRELRKFTREIDEGHVKPRKGPNATVGSLLVEWLGHLERTGRARTTIDSYRLIAERHLIPALGDLPLRKVDGHVLDSYYAAKAATGGSVRSGDALGANTIRVHHAILSSAFTQAVKWGWLGANPAEQATPPAKRKPDRRAPEPETVQKLIDACANEPELGLAITLGALTGARRGELCGLQWHDVDWDRGLLRIARQRVPAKGGDVTVPTKSKSPRVLSIGAPGVAVLRRYRAILEERASALGVEIPSDGWLISPDAGVSPIRSKWLGEAISTVSQQSGVRITTHLLRYFAATQMVGAGVDVRTAAGRLGHAPEIMLRVYADFMPRRDREAASLLEALVLDPPSRKAEPS